MSQDGTGDVVFYGQSIRLSDPGQSCLDQFEQRKVFICIPFFVYEYSPLSRFFESYIPHSPLRLVVLFEF